MRIPGIKTFRRAGQWIHSRFSKHALILGYHRVTDKPNDLYETCVSPNHFQEQMEVLHRFAKVVSLQDLNESIIRGQLSRHSIAITFDDGYSDLFYTVKPILDYYRLPCTVYIVTGCLGQEYWWDELERLIRASEFGSDASIWSLYQQLLHLPLKDRRRVMHQLREQTAVAPVESGRSRAMTLDELVELANAELIDIGSHGVNHTSLGQLSIDEQKSELLESKSFLEDHLGKPVSSFSYPNGLYSPTSRELVFETGYTCACGSNPGVIFYNSDRYQLSRFWIPDWDGETFKRWLSRWL